MVVSALAGCGSAASGTTETTTDTQTSGETQTQTQEAAPAETQAEPAAELTGIDAIIAEAAATRLREAGFASNRASAMAR